MPALSGIDAIQPALARTREFLFRPFRLGTYLKLCLVACLCEGSGSSGTFQTRLPQHSSRFFRPPTVHPHWVAIGIAALVLLVALSLALYYLLTRLRFAFFHCLVHHTREIRPGWRLYREQAGRFFWLNVKVGLCMLLVFLLLAIPFLLVMWRVFHPELPDAQPNIALLLGLFLLMVPLLMLYALAGLMVNIILRDFMLPHFALEGATARQAWRQVQPRILAERSGFFVYALLRLALPLAAFIGLFFLLMLPALLFSGLFLLLHAAVHAASGSFALAGLILEWVVGVAGASALLLLSLGLGGPAGVALRQYAILFYGSRYQPLSNLLWPAPPDTAPLAPGTL